MAYRLVKEKSRFRLPAANKPAALAALKTVLPSDSKVQGASSLEGALAELHWWPKLDGGDIAGLYVHGDGFWTTQLLLASIAPYVAPGSCLEMLSDDGQIWRWVFDGQRCERVDATIAWPSSARGDRSGVSVEQAGPSAVYEVTIRPQPSLTYWVRTTSPDRARAIAFDAYYQESHEVDCSASPCESEVGYASSGTYREDDVIDDPDVA